MLKNVSKITLMLTIIFASIFVLSGNIKAVDKFPDKINAKINANSNGTYHVLNYGGVNLFAKDYTSTSPENAGKAFCSAFSKTAPGWYPVLKAQTCTATGFSSNSETNKKVAASIGAIISKARSVSSSMSWETYYYAELAINQFLYNGYTGKKGFGVSYNNIGNVSSATQSKIQPYLSAANYQYNNFGNTKVSFSSMKYVGNTVEAVVKCTDYAGKTKSCSLTATATVTIDGTEQTVTPSISGTKVTVDLNSLIGNLSTDTKHTITTSITVKDTVKYNSAQNYNCGTNTAGQSLQSMIPNLLKPGTFVVDTTKKVTKTTSVTDEPTGGLNVKKYDSDTGSFLEGSVVEIYQDNELILTEEIPANETGLEIENLSYGRYCIKEISSKNGYKLDKYTIDGAVATPETNGVCVDIKDGKTSASINVYNKKDITTLTVNKVDKEGNTVKGAKLKVFYVDVVVKEGTTTSSDGDSSDVDNNEYNVVGVASWTTDGNSKTIEVEVGKTYMVVEDVPPEGYTPIINSVEITANSDASKNVVTLTNVYSSFKISKQDITNKEELPGAKLEIRDERGFVMASWESTDAPQEITGLVDGNYTLTETTAPNGYTVAETINFTIENGKLKDDDDNTLVMYDKLVVDVPDTFSTKNIVTMLIGLIMVGSGTGVLIYEFKKKKTA